jgi:hypothetical protein
MIIVISYCNTPTGFTKRKIGDVSIFLETSPILELLSTNRGGVHEGRISYNNPEEPGRHDNRDFVSRLTRPVHIRSAAVMIVNCIMVLINFPNFLTAAIAAFPGKGLRWSCQQNPGQQYSAHAQYVPFVSHGFLLFLKASFCPLSPS